MIPTGMVDVGGDHGGPGGEVWLGHCVEHMAGGFDISVARVSGDHDVPRDGAARGHFVKQDAGIGEESGGVGGEERSSDVEVGGEAEFEDVGVKVAGEREVVGGGFKGGEEGEGVEEGGGGIEGRTP